MLFGENAKIKMTEDKRKLYHISEMRQKGKKRKVQKWISQSVYQNNGVNKGDFEVDFGG